MKIVPNEDSFELHLHSSITNNTVITDNKEYLYKRLVIPNVLMNYLLEINENLKYIYLYFVEDHVFLSGEKVPDCKYSKRKVMKFRNKNSYFINLNSRSLLKHGITVDENVVFVIGNNNFWNSDDNISIELVFK